MKTTSIITITMLMSISLIAQSGRGELREGLEARKVAFITQELSLTAEEAQRFWPIYNQYEEQIAGLRKKYAVTRNSDLKDLTDAQARTTIDNYLMREQEKLTIRQSLVKDLNGVISDKKVAVLLGLEGEFKRRLLKAMNKRRGNNNR